METLVAPIEEFVNWICRLAPEDTFFSQGFAVSGVWAIVMVRLICGAIGSLVVGNRMAFFSDALAHCAFAGVALGLVTGLLAGLPVSSNFYNWGVNAIMVV